MAQTARTETDKTTNTAQNATSNVAELGKRTTDQAVDVARDATAKVEEAARSGFQTMQRTSGAALEIERAVARRSAEGATELSQAFSELVNEQTRHNVETFKALTSTVDWGAVARIQGEFLRVSMDRAAQLTRRYFEVAQAVMVSAASATKDQAKKAA